MTQSLLDAALGYAKRGWPVFPVYEPAGASCACGNAHCDHPAKHPRTSHGFLDARTDEAQIRTWWTHWPNANIGIATEAAGLIVLDVDPERGDSSGNLYVSNFFSNNVKVYAAGSNTVLRTIHDGVSNPVRVMLDSANNVYVGNGESANSVTIYKPGSTTPWQTITDGIANVEAMTLDSSGHLYVANVGAGTASGPYSVTVYSPGTFNLVETITEGVSDPTALVVGSAGTLYVANQASFTVTEYALGSTSPTRTISRGIQDPLGADCLTFDGLGNLYVANAGGHVTVYAPGSTEPLRKIRKGIGTFEPLSVAIGPNGYLNVGNLASGPSYDSSVTVYRPERRSLDRTITAGIDYPQWLGFGP